MRSAAEAGSVPCNINQLAANALELTVSAETETAQAHAATNAFLCNFIVILPMQSFCYCKN
jgi:hypothetical protein